MRCRLTNHVTAAVLFGALLLAIGALPAAAATTSHPKATIGPLAPVLLGPPSMAAAGSWARVFGGSQDDYAGMSKQTTDGGYIFSGETSSFGAGGRDLWLLKMNSSGAFVWQKTYGTSQDDTGTIEPLADGGFLLELWSTGMESKTILAKLDSSGNIQWQKQIGASGDSFFGATPLSGGGFLLSGSKFDMQTFQFVFRMIRLDSSGNIVWQKQYLAEDTFTGTAQELADGSFIVIGNNISLTDEDANVFLMKLSSTGDIQWQKTYGGDYPDFGFQVLPITGGYLLAATTQSFGPNAGDEELTDIWLLKLDSGGNVQWEYSYGGAQEEIGFLFELGGSHYLSGTTNSFGAGKEDAFLAKLNSDGTVVWAKSYGGPDDDGLFGFPDGSGGLLLQGETTSHGAGKEDILAIKTDASGNVSWQHTYGGSNDDNGFLTRLTDGSYLLSGDTNTWGAGGWDAWAMQLESSGQLSSGLALAACAIVGTTSIQPISFSFTVTASQATVANTSTAASTMSLAATTVSVITVGTSTATAIDPCTAAQNLTATASADPTSGSPPLTVNFTGSGAGGTGPYTYSWDFGDGGSSTAQNPSYIYNNAGTFVATLTVTDSTAATATDTVTITVSSGGGQLTVTASADKTSGAAPLAVQFTGSATGGTPPYLFYVWDFGDENTAFAQNPSHTYTTAGTYQARLTVTDSAFGVAFDTITINATSGQTCSLTCAATVPTSGVLNVPVPFVATYQATGCTGSPSFAWTFGDGQNASTQNPTHTYMNASTYSWSLAVTLDQQVCNASGQITVSAAQELLYTVPSVAHAPGKNQTAWRTNIAAVNRNASTASMVITFTPYDPPGGSPTVRNATLAAGATIEWEDVLVSLFGFSSSASNKGSVQIASTLPLYVTSRTYNQTATGTFGQYYPALATADALSPGQEGVIPQIKKNTAFRSNVGMQNLGLAPVSIDVKLFNASGAQIGSTLNYSVKVGRYYQYDDVFAKASAPSADIAYATTEVKTVGGRMWSYGSVVDNATGDPTTVPVLSGSPTGPFVTTAAAHAPGKNQTAWRTNLAAANRGASSANLTLTYYPYDTGTPTVVRTYTLAAGATVEWEDVLVSLFGFSASASNKGSIHIASTRAVYVTSRTYNQTATGTFGQYYQATPITGGITTGQVAVIPQIKKTTDFRSNVGVQNLGSASCAVAVKLYDANGTQVGSTLTRTLPGYAYYQWDDVFAKASAPSQAIAYATFEVQTAGGRAWAYGSVVDNATGDPTTIPALVQ